LRQRQEDIPLLVNYFLEIFNKKYGKDFRRVSPEAEEILLNHPWKGNVRELKNAIERVTLLEDSTEMKPEHLDFLTATHPSPAPDKRPREVYEFPPSRIPPSGICLDDVIKQIISAAYKQTNKNQVRTAKLLGITRNTLLYRLKKYGIR
jgi:DNA-binding NtrC family response regulator